MACFNIFFYQLLCFCNKCVSFLSSHICYGVTQYFIQFILFIFNSQHRRNLYICRPFYLSQWETLLPCWLLKYPLCWGVSMIEWLCRLPLSFLLLPSDIHVHSRASYLTFTWVCVWVFLLLSHKSCVTSGSPYFFDNQHQSLIHNTALSY